MSEYLNNKIFESIIARFQQAKRDRAKYELMLADIRLREVSLRKRAVRPSPWNIDQARISQAAQDFHDAEVELAYAFYTLSENIVRYAKFNLIDEQDAIQEGVLICFSKIDHFDPLKGKAFNYMTTCILNHFRQLYRAARNYNELKKKYLDFLQAKFEAMLVRNGKERPSYRNLVSS